MPPAPAAPASPPGPAGPSEEPSAGMPEQDIIHALCDRPGIRIGHVHDPVGRWDARMERTLKDEE